MVIEAVGVIEAAVNLTGVAADPTEVGAGITKGAPVGIEAGVASTVLEEVVFENRAGMCSRSELIFRSTHHGSLSVFLANEPAHLDSRLTDASQDSLIASFKALKLRPDDRPLRPGFGNAGTAIKLRCNFFPIKVPKGPLYEYDVAITPNTTIRRVKRRIFQLAQASGAWSRYNLKGRVAHDHTSKLIAAGLLKQPLSIEVPYYDEDEKGPKEGGKQYTLSIEFARELETESLLE